MNRNLRDALFVIVAIFFGIRGVGRIHDSWIDPEWDGVSAFVVFSNISIIVMALQIIRIIADDFLDERKRRRRERQDREDHQQWMR